MSDLDIFNLKLRADLYDTINKLSSSDLTQAHTLIESLYKKYLATPEKSALARINFFQQLHQKMNQWYQTTIYQKKSLWEKIKNFFGFSIADNETGLLNLLRDINVEKERAEKTYEVNWNTEIPWLDWLIRLLKLDRLVGNEFFFQGNLFKIRYLSH